MKASGSDALTLVKDWMQASHPELADIDLDLDLIENRVIDSLQFVEFFLFLEEITGREITVSKISVNSFRTLRAILNNYLKEAHDEK